MSRLAVRAELLESLRTRYAHVHPLIFLRSVERARSSGDLFDILESFPGTYPLAWDEDAHAWCRTEDLLQARRGENTEP
jgi:hypothetical protein